MQRIALSKDLELSQIIYGMWRLGDDHDTSPAAVQAKIEATKRRNGTWAVIHQRGGNGNLTIQQQSLHAALGAGWVMEYNVKEAALPNWRVVAVDLAYPTLRLAVEVDGASHRSTKQRNRDQRKAKMLTDTGWTLIRFWNSKIDQDLLGAVEDVQRQMTILSQNRMF